jgi:hypothetical protein
VRALASGVEGEAVVDVAASGQRLIANCEVRSNQETCYDLPKALGKIGWLMEQRKHDYLINVIQPFLNADDDPAFWTQAIEVFAADVEFEIAEGGRHRNILMNVEACSHWLRPHQTRWMAAGGFAWPTGYGGTRWSRSGLPQFDWSIELLWNAHSQIWEIASRLKRKRALTFRAALPTRTLRHNQAAIHTIWQRGSPTVPTKKCVRLYGFRKKQQEWTCVASKDWKPEKP